MKYNGFKKNQKNNFPKVWQYDENNTLPQRKGEIAKIRYGLHKWVGLGFVDYISMQILHKNKENETPELIWDGYKHENKIFLLDLSTK